ncbi:MAG: metallophosphoesterase [Ruminococcus sp.]|nr:metallophosphoesterase [Ruminococcus sp.]
MKKRKKIILLILIMFLCSITVNITISDRTLTVSNYNIKTDKYSSSFRAVVLSDLHNKEYGKENIRLIQKVKEQKPDIIFTLGDFVTKFDSNKSTSLKLYKELTKICRVYSVPGNHETHRSYSEFVKLKEEIRATGVTLLINQAEKVKINGDCIVVGGLRNYPYFEYLAPDYDCPEKDLLESVAARQKDNFVILLNHHPEYLYWGLHGNKVDLMLCGHTHGGIIRLPYIGGLLAPNQGILSGREILPVFTKGLYKKDGTTMIITGGLGNEVPLPRYFNPPEISVIDIN